MQRYMARSDSGVRLSFIMSRNSSSLAANTRSQAASF
jgi:hypothetical protein